MPSNERRQPPFVYNTFVLCHWLCIHLQDEHAKLDTTVSGRGRWNDIDQKRTVLTAKLKLLKEKEGKLLLKRVDQATYSQGIFALVSIPFVLAVPPLRAASIAPGMQDVRVCCACAL
jgi:hypothetical protein